MDLHILAICTGNICRSPAVERLFTARLPASVTVSSAGTRAVVGSPIAPPMAALLRRVSAETSDFEARQITDALINEADLILTATVAHRGTVVSMRPTAMRRSFTLLEFSRSMSYLNAGSLANLSLHQRIRCLADHVCQTRPRMRLPEAELDIPDPYGLGQEVYNTSFALINQAVATISHQLTMS